LKQASGGMSSSSSSGANEKFQLLQKGLGAKATWGAASAPSKTQSAIGAACASFMRKRGYQITEPQTAKRQCVAPKEVIPLMEARESFCALVQWISTLEVSKHPSLLEAVLPVLIMLFFSLLDIGLLEVAQSLIKEHGSVFAALSDDSRRTILFLQGIRTKDDLISENVYAQFWEGQHQVKVSLPRDTYDVLLSRLEQHDVANLSELVFASVEARDGDSQGDEASTTRKDIQDDAKRLNRKKLQILTDVINPPMAYGKWQGIVAALSPEGKQTHSRAVYSAKSIQKCGLPLPSGNSHERQLASKHFAKLSLKRDLVDSNYLPSTFDFFVGSSDAQEDVNCISVSNNMKHCVAGGIRGARFWNINAPISTHCSLQNSPCMLLHHDDGPEDCRVLDAEFSPSDEWLLTAGHTGRLALWTVRLTKKLASFPLQRQPEPFWSVDWCPTGHYFVSSGCNGEGLLWSIDELQPVRVFTTPKNVLPVGQQTRSNARIVKCHPSARYVAVASESNLMMWDLPSARPARIFEKSRNTTALAFSKDGAFLAAGRTDGCIDIWNVATGRRQQQLLGVHSGSVTALDFSWPSTTSLNYSLLFSGSSDGDMQFRPMCSSNVRPVGPAPVKASTLSASSHLSPAASIISGAFTPANTLLVGHVPRQVNHGLGK